MVLEIKKVKYSFSQFVDVVIFITEYYLKVDELEQAINLSPSHLSCYCLTIEKETVFHKMLIDGSLKIDSDDIIKSQFLLMRKILISENFSHYEISSFAKKGKESIRKNRKV